MCGIFGVWCRDSADLPDQQSMEQVKTTLAERGSDAKGTLQHKNFILVHSRLSIIDTSTSANQPLWDVTKRYAIVFNGVIYNYKILREQLIEQGESFITTSDTEVLLLMFKKYGPEMLEKLNGFFAFAILDTFDDSVFLARDRYGIKPLYLFEQEDQWIFSSSLKAIQHQLKDAEIDWTSLQLYLQLNYIPGTNSILNKVSLLKPGSYKWIRKNIIEEKSYFKPILQSKGAYKKDAYVPTFKSLLEESVEERLTADVPLGCFLSGGIDSSVIASIASKHQVDIPAFSLGFQDEPFFDETELASKTAKKLKIPHHIFKIGLDEMIEEAHQLLEAANEPFADSSGIAFSLLSKYTAKEVKVALSGDGADELLGGYVKHRADYIYRTFPATMGFIRLIDQLIPEKQGSRNDSLANLKRRIKRFSGGSAYSEVERYWNWCTVMKNEEAKELLRFPPEENDILIRKESLLKAINQGNDFNSILNNDLELVLQNDMLVKADRHSMKHGLEVRVPFLDHHLVEMVRHLPSSEKVSLNQGKLLLRKAYAKDLLPEVLQSKKRGFEVPLYSILKEGFHEVINGQLLSDDFIRHQNIFNNDALMKIKQQFYSGQVGDSPYHLWTILNFQYWWNLNYNHG